MGELPPGYRFFPTEEELVSFYLPSMLEGRMLEKIQRVIPVCYIYGFSPWDLPRELCRGGAEEWFFFIPQPEREARGGRPNRLTPLGYWKATGSPGFVVSSNNRIIGWKRTMVFYNGRAPDGKKTEWKMNEFLVIDGEASASTGAIPQLRQEFSLCRVYKKSRCLRSFDRRPPPILPTGEAMGGHAYHGECSTMSNQSHAVVDVTSSTHTSSGEQGNHSQAEASEDWDMAIDCEPLWDLERYLS
ncbi:hypothetical protein NMG60_11001497 [Bertholletia excelsa]